jgi:hypothetical protein
VQARIAIYDEKIKTEKENIETARRALKQLDEGVDQVLGRSTTETGANRAVALRRSQQKERGRLLAEISQSQKSIAELNDARAPIAAEIRKVEAEVGPLKYIAKLIYGDNPDANLLEKAVTWVIILLVVVFDPLAIMMLLAATESRGWILAGRRKTAPPEPETLPVPEEIKPDVPTEKEPAPPTYTNGYTAVIPTVQSVDIVTQPPVTAEPTQKENTIKSGLIPVERDFPPIQVNEDEHDIANEKDELVRAAKRAWKDDHPTSTLKEQRRLFEQGQIDHLPWQDYLPAAATTSFGPVSPAAPKKGQMFLRTDVVPTRLYKYNGQKWIEVNKDLTDQYVFDDAYIEFLMDKIVNGEYDQDLLTEAERNQIELRLK